MKTIIVSIIIIASLQYNHSQNGWVQVNPGFNQSYNSVHFTDANTGMACGYNGAIIKSNDGGANWINLNSGTNYNLNDIKLFNSNTATAVGDNQLIIRTTNGGLNWFIVNQGSPVSNSIVNLNINNNVQATAYSWYYSNPYEYTYVYRTTNSGEVWTIQQVYVSNRSIHFIDLNTGWANGLYYTGPPLYQYYLEVRKTTNGGTNWGLIYSSSGVSINPGLIYFYNSTIGFKINHIGQVYLYRTLSGGTSWISSPGLPSNYSNMIRCFFLVNSQVGWFVADNSIIYYTTNTGELWTQQTCPVSTNLKKVYFINENTGWIAASEQGILKTTNGGTATGITKIGNEIPSSFILHQNYPNPFNPTTKIRFNLPVTSAHLRNGQEGGVQIVSLIIYDLLGREVASLIPRGQEGLLPGTYEVEFDGCSYASGVYFYSLVAENYFKTNKMILLR